MRKVETKKVLKEVEEIIVDKHLCDKCGKDLKNDIEGMFDAFSFGVSYEVGTSFPEGFFGERKELELCKKCAKEAYELLSENGFKFVETEN